MLPRFRDGRGQIAACCPPAQVQLSGAVPVRTLQLCSVSFPELSAFSSTWDSDPHCLGLAPPTHRRDALLPADRIERPSPGDRASTCAPRPILERMRLWRVPPGTAAE